LTTWIHFLVQVTFTHHNNSNACWKANPKSYTVFNDTTPRGCIVH
jgi:hypothetical protein